VSIVVDALVIVGGLALGRLIVRSVRARRNGGRDAAAAPPSSSPSSLSAVDPFAAFPCKLGDVVIRVAERDEAWLAGALVFQEERPIAALFVAPEAGVDRAVLAREGSGGSLTWLAPLASGDLALTSDPPHTIEHAGVRFERTRRLPVRVERVGTGAPQVGESAVVAEYAAAGAGADRIVVVAGVEKAVAWRGVALAPGEYDVLPGGSATLDES
jgi:hypothetical protein